MKASYVKRQANAATAKHDSRDFDIVSSDHIDETRSDDNRYYTWNSDEDENRDYNFEKSILSYYEKTYRAALDQTNENYIKQRHPERCKTMKEYMESNKHMPEMTVLQIGNVTDDMDADKLEECFIDYLEWFNEWSEEHGKPFKVLTAALHVDEATPHIHMTTAWNGKDKYGNTIANRSNALERAGISLPDPDKKETRTNNRNVTFTRICREKWYDICEEHGISIDREPIPNQKGKDKGDYVRDREKDYMSRSEALQQQQSALDREKKALRSYEANAIKETEALIEDLQKDAQDIQIRLSNTTREQMMEQYMKGVKLGDGVSMFDRFKKWEQKKLVEMTKPKQPKQRTPYQEKMIQKARREARRKIDMKEEMRKLDASYAAIKSKHDNGFDFDL